MSKCFWGIALLALAGCASLNPQTQAALAGFSPLDADPEGFEFTVDLPDGLILPPGVPTFTFVAERQDSGARIEETVVLEAVNPDGAQDLTYRFGAQDVSVLRAAQGAAKSWHEETNGESKGSIRVELAACQVGEGPEKDATTSVTLRTTAGGPDLPLVTDMPVSKLLSRAGTASSGGDICAGIR